MNYTYLLVTMLILALSLFFFLNRRSGPYKGRRLVLLAALVVSAFLFLLSFLLERIHIVNYNKQYITGFFIGRLPVEELLFCAVMPFAAISIYGYLNVRFPGNGPDRFSLTVSNLLMGLCVSMIFFGWRTGNLYDVGVYLVLGLLLAFIEYINRLRFMYRFYRSWITGMILFYPVYFAVTGLPHLPAYFMGITLLAVYLSELFRRGWSLKSGETL